MNESTLTSWTPVICSCRNLKRWKAAYIVWKPHTLGWDCRATGIICLYCWWLRKLPFTSKRVCKIQFISEFCNRDPMITLHIAGFCNKKSKSVILRNWNIVWGERTEEPKFEQRNTIDTLLPSKIIHFYKFFPTTPKLSTTTDDNRSPNTMSSVTFPRRCVKFSSSLSGSPAN